MGGGPGLRLSYFSSIFSLWCRCFVLHLVDVTHALFAKGLKPFLHSIWLILCAVSLRNFVNFATAVNDITFFLDDFFLCLMFIYLLDVVVRCIGLGWSSFRANGWNLFDVVVSLGSFITTLAVRFQDDGFVIQQLQKLFLVSIAFKLVQRMNSLNMLFKTAVYVFLMWLILERFCI